MAKNDVRATMEEGSYPLFVLRRYASATGKSDRAALEFILERWAFTDASASSYGVLLEDFTRERAQANVTPIKKELTKDQA